MNHCTVVEIAPVIYCGSAGGGNNEYPASSNPDNPNTYPLDVPVPDDYYIDEAWYAPFHNIPAIMDFALVDVTRHSDRQVSLRVASWPGRESRVRIKICVHCCPRT